MVLKGETHLVNIQFTETGPLQIQKVRRDRKLIQGCSFNTMEGNVIESDDSEHVHVIENQIVIAKGDAVAIRGHHNDTVVSNNLICGT